MSFVKELPKLTDDPQKSFIAVWLDKPHTALAPISCASLHSMVGWPGNWTWYRISELIQTLREPEIVYQVPPIVESKLMTIAKDLQDLIEAL